MHLHLRENWSNFEKIFKFILRFYRGINYLLFFFFFFLFLIVLKLFSAISLGNILAMKSFVFIFCSLFLLFCIEKQANKQPTNQPTAVATLETKRMIGYLIRACLSRQ